MWLIYGWVVVVSRRFAQHRNWYMFLWWALFAVVTEEEEKKDQGDVRGKFVAFSFTLDWLVFGSELWASLWKFLDCSLNACIPRSLHGVWQHFWWKVAHICNLMPLLYLPKTFTRAGSIRCSSDSLFLLSFPCPELAICVSWSFCCGISALKHSFHIWDWSKTFSLQIDDTIVQKLCLQAVFDTAMQGLGMPYSGRERNESPPSPEVYAGPVPLVVVESGEPHHAFPCWS